MHCNDGPPTEAAQGFGCELRSPAKALPRGLVRTFHGSLGLRHGIIVGVGPEKPLPLLIEGGASWNSRIASRTHQQGDYNVDCTSNFRFVGLVDRNPCYVHELHRSGRFGRPATFDRRSGSWHAPLECKTFAISRTSPCSVRASRRRAGRYPLDCAIFRFRLVSWTCALRTVLALSKGCGHFSQVLVGRAAGQTDTC